MDSKKPTPPVLEPCVICNDLEKICEQCEADMHEAWENFYEEYRQWEIWQLIKKEYEKMYPFEKKTSVLHTYFFTLTHKASLLTTQEIIDQLKASIAKIEKSKVVDYIEYCWETHKDGRPHIHGIVYAKKYLDQKNHYARWAPTGRSEFKLVKDKVQYNKWRSYIQKEQRGHSKEKQTTLKLLQDFQLENQIFKK